MNKLTSTLLLFLTGLYVSAQTFVIQFNPQIAPKDSEFRITIQSFDKDEMLTHVDNEMLEVGLQSFEIDGAVGLCNLVINTPMGPYTNQFLVPSDSSLFYWNLMPDAKLQDGWWYDKPNQLFYGLKAVVDSINTIMVEAFRQSDSLTYKAELKKLNQLFDIWEKNEQTRPFIAYLKAPQVTLIPGREQADNLRYLLKHFFDQFDPSDTTLLYSPFYRSKIETYMALAVKKDPNAVLEYADKFMDKARGSTSAFEAAAKLLWEWANLQSQYELAVHMDVNYQTERCDAGTDIDLQNRIKQYPKLKDGLPAPEIEWDCTNGQMATLEDVKSPQLLVIFWGSWCPHCREELPLIHEKVSQNENIKVIAIGLDEDEKPWKDAIKPLKGWIHIQAAEKFESLYAEDYAISSTPTYFLLDEDKKIITKGWNAEKILESIK